MQRVLYAARAVVAPEDANSRRARNVDGEVWYADKFLYPNNWSQGRGGAVLLPGISVLRFSYRDWVVRHALAVVLVCLAAMEEAMSAAEIEQRRRDLLVRIARRRAEVCAYLDAQFYTRCRAILQRVLALDERQVFRANPAELPQYSTYVRKPMYWELIEKRLRVYEYSAASDFVEDMRLVVDNCYAYNGHHSPFSATARQVELLMEDLFVKELGVAPPPIRELHQLGSQLPKEASTAVWKVLQLYEHQREQPGGTKVHIRPATFRCATQRRILEVLRIALARRERQTTAQRGGGGAASQPASKAARVERPAVTQTLAAHGAPRPTRAMLRAEAEEVEFHEASGAASQPASGATLERVPQNARSDCSRLREISPVHMDDEEDEEDGFGAKPSVSPSLGSTAVVQNASAT